MSNINDIKFTTVAGHQTQTNAYELSKENANSQILALYKLMQKNPTIQFTQDDVEKLYGQTNIASRLFTPLFKAGYIRAGGKIKGNSGVLITSYLINNATIELDFDKIKEVLSVYNEQKKIITRISKLHELILSNDNQLNDAQLNSLTRMVSDCFNAYRRHKPVWNEFNLVFQDVNSCLEYIYKQLS